MPFDPRDPVAAARRPPLPPRAVLGAFVAAAGALLLLDRLGMASAGLIVRQFWPVAVIVIGGLLVRQQRTTGPDGRRAGGANGILVMGIGVWLLLNTLGVTNIHFWDLFWPLCLILIGVLLITHARRRPGRATTSDDHVALMAVLGGVKRQVDTRQFRGGDVTAFMGGCNLDLRQASIPPGEDAVLDVFAVMGGCEIAVPTGWVVTTEIVPVMGGIEDRRLPPLPSAPGQAPPSRLILRGFVLMGGVEIKS